MNLTRRSPAKVNLFLKVISKRPDGYHNIVSIVTPISLYDTIHLSDAAHGGIGMSDDKNILPTGPENTMYRAAALLKERYSVTRGVDIHVEKRIPIGSGLGGPSSNAATVLRSLVELWGLTVDEKELFDMGTSIGADVPLFLYGKPCIMEGIGERITPVSLPPMWFVIVYPGVIMKASDVYRGLRIVLTKEENEVKVRRKFEVIQDVADILENDLEHVSIIMCPQISSVKEALIEAGALGALMSGSGSSVFGIFSGGKEAEQASLRIIHKGSVFTAQSLEKEGGYGDHRCEGVSG